MTYQFISVDEKAKKSYLWATFKNDKKKMFVFVSYLLGGNNTEQFYIKEVETGNVVKLVSFAAHYGITKDDIKKSD